MSRSPHADDCGCDPQLPYCVRGPVPTGDELAQWARWAANNPHTARESGTGRLLEYVAILRAQLREARP